MNRSEMTEKIGQKIRKLVKLHKYNEGDELCNRIIAYINVGS